VADKRTTVEDMVGELRSGMTIGIGGWGSRRKPMAVVRAGKVEVMEVDEGMFFLGLQAAAWRVPFLPTRAGLGSDVLTINPDIQLVRSPYGVASPYLSDPADADVELVAMPALHLDAAIVHANRADTAGNAQVLSPDAFFDPLFLGAAERRFVTAERIVENGTLAGGTNPLSSVPIHRMLTDAVAPAPGGAHFTANPPDYGRDEAFQKEYAAAAGDPAEWEAFAHRYVLVTEDEYQARIRGRAPA